MTRLLKAYLNANLLKRIIAGLLLGAAVGIALGFAPASTVDSYAGVVGIFGSAFVRLLKMIVVPVVAFSIVCGSASIDPGKLGRVGVKTLLFYFVTSAAAVTIGLIIGNVFQPGAGFNVVGEAAGKVATKEAPSLSAILLSMIPTNPVAALAKGEMLAIILFAMLFGFALSFARGSKDELVAKSAETVFLFCNGVAEAMYKIVAGIMQYAPIGVFVLISLVFAQQGPRAIGPLLMVIFCIYLGYGIQFLLVYGGSLALSKTSPFKFFKKINEVMVTAFVTRSSSGTLPITLRVAEEKLHIPRSISAFTLPLGATINMGGTSLYLGVCAMFICNAIGHPLALSQQLAVVLTATLAAVGTAGVPGAGVIMLLMVLDTIGLKMTAGSAVAAAYAMILGIDAILDMGRTWLNVTGDITGTYLVAKSENELLD